jgi:hypothetical protein
MGLCDRSHVRCVRFISDGFWRYSFVILNVTETKSE